VQSHLEFCNLYHGAHGLTRHGGQTRPDQTSTTETIGGLASLPAGSTHNSAAAVLLLLPEPACQ